MKVRHLTQKIEQEKYKYFCNECIYNRVDDRLDYCRKSRMFHPKNNQPYVCSYYENSAFLE